MPPMGLVSELLHQVNDQIDYFLTPSPREVKCRYKGHAIAVVLDAQKISLFVDAKQEADSHLYLRPRKDASLLRAELKEGSKSHLIEVYGMSGFFKPRIKICIDNKRVAGDRF